MSKKSRINIKPIITASITILAVIVVVLSGVGFYILHTALSPVKWAKDIDATYKRMFEDYPFLEGWVSSLNERGAINEMEICLLYMGSIKDRNGMDLTLTQRKL